MITTYGKQPREARLFPTSNSYGHQNLKWVVKDSKLAFNRVHIGVTHFGLLKSHNPNMSILSPRNPFVQKDFFIPIVREDTGWVLNPLPVANESCIWDGVVGDSLRQFINF
jgi:hypothetical protein